MAISKSLKALEAAKDKLRNARRKLDAMRTAKSLDDLAVFWEEFLTEQHRVFLRLKKATEYGSGKGWFDLITHDQRVDPLLGYMLHARDAAEHGIEKITEKMPPAIGLVPKNDGVLHIKHLEFNNKHGRMEINADPDTLKQFKFSFIPAKIQLIAVVDRGTVYPPPKMHLGKEIEKDINLIGIAELAITYLEQKVDEAGARYVK